MNLSIKYDASEVYEYALFLWVWNFSLAYIIISNLWAEEQQFP